MILANGALTEVGGFGGLGEVGGDLLIGMAPTHFDAGREPVSWSNGNPNLDALTGFGALSSVRGALMVVDNPLLPSEPIDALLDNVGLDNVERCVAICPVWDDDCVCR